MFRRTLIVGAVCALGLAGCASTRSQSVFGPLPEGKNARLKRFKAAANKQMARLDLACKNIYSMAQVLGDKKRRAEIAEDDLKRIKIHHDQLRLVMQDVDAVRAEVTAEPLKSAFERYVSTLKAVADAPYGELTEDMVLAWQNAASDLEPLVD